jgi:DNA polymerase III subunit epsilon
MDIQYELYRKAIENAGNWLADPRTVILDTETTDLAGYLVEIAIIDVAGNVLLNTRVNPQSPISAQASAIHGHTADTLANAPLFPEIVDSLITTLTGRRVVIYNQDFDTAIIKNELRRWYYALWDGRVVPNANEPGVERRDWTESQIRMVMGRAAWNCAMMAYSDYVGDWNHRHGNNRWQRLPGGDHSALGDCQATLAILKKIAAAAEKE